MLERVKALKPDLVVLSGMSGESYASDLKWTWNSREDMVRGYREMLSAFAAAGIRTAVIKDLPRPGDQVPRCLERNRDVTVCGTPRAEAFAGKAILSLRRRPASPASRSST